jgi:hypothetical protein
MNTSEVSIREMRLSQEGFGLYCQCDIMFVDHGDRNDIRHGTLGLTLTVTNQKRVLGEGV